MFLAQYYQWKRRVYRFKFREKNVLKYKEIIEDRELSISND